MAEQYITLYPGDELHVAVSAGQAPEDEAGDPNLETGDTASDQAAGGVEPDSTPEVAPGTAPDEPVNIDTPAAGTVDSPVEHG